MKKKKILIITSKAFNPYWKGELEKTYKKAEIFFIEDIKDEILKHVGKCNAMIGCPRYVFKKQDFDFFKHLDWIHAGGAGIEDFVGTNLKKSNLTFTNGKIIQGPEVADHAIALLLYFCRNFNEIIQNKKLSTTPIEIHNKKALIFGLGGIGFNIAERLNAHGAKVDAISNELPVISNNLHNIFYKMQDIDLGIYDFIFSAAPLTFRTEFIFNFSFFKKMKNESVFINVSRGKLVRTEDLLKNKIYKKFRGIGLDVTDPEPLPVRHKLKNIKNVFITPHIAGLSDNNRERGYELIKENLYRYLNNQELLNIVDKKKEY